MGRFAPLARGIVGALVALLMCSGALRGFGQSSGAAANGAAKEHDAGVGNYSIVERLVEWSAETHLINPPLSVSVERASRAEPKDVLGKLEVAQERSIAGMGKPRYICVPAVPREHGCEAIDHVTLTIRGPNWLEYHIQNHGAAVELRINVLVHELAPVSRAGAKTVWHAGDVIFVGAARGTPPVGVISTILVGEWNHEAVVFEVGKPLTGKAAVALDDLSTNQDLGDKVLYSYRVKAPGKGS